MTTAYPYILVVNPSLGVKTVAEFVALAKSKPGQLNYGTAGVGASNHLVTELFDGKAGIKMTHIPYRGTSLAVADLISGQVQVVFADPVSALAQVRAGTLTALAVTSKDRSPVAPDLPTIAESGYPGFDAIAWHGILAPAGTPPAIIDRLNAEIVKALKDPETIKLIEAQAMQIVGNYAGGLCRLHQAGHRALEGRGAAGQGRGEVICEANRNSSAAALENARKAGSWRAFALPPRETAA